MHISSTQNDFESHTATTRLSVQEASAADPPCKMLSKDELILPQIRPSSLAAKETHSAKTQDMKEKTHTIKYFTPEQRKLQLWYHYRVKNLKRPFFTTEIKRETEREQQADTYTPRETHTHIHILVHLSRTQTL